MSDLTRCLDLLRFDPRFNIRWDIEQEKPFSKRFIHANVSNYKKNFNFVYAIFLFLLTSSLLVFIPTNNKYELRDSNITSQTLSQETE